MRQTPQRQAQRAIQKAVRAGYLQRPETCSLCGVRAWKVRGEHSYTNRKGETSHWIEFESANMVAHHWAGYDERDWLNVWWICPSCHRRLHRYAGDRTLSIEQARDMIANWQPTKWVAGRGCPVRDVPNHGVQPTAELAGSQPIAAESETERQPAAADA